MFDIFKKSNKESQIEEQNAEFSTEAHNSIKENIYDENIQDTSEMSGNIFESEPRSKENPKIDILEPSEIGIVELMDKRAKLEEAIDYVGLMIKNLKDKRTILEKNIEEESVDIKNLKEKLEKVSQYIEEENKGIKELTQKRQQVENEADEVGSLIHNLRDRLSGIDRIIDNESHRIKKIRDSDD